MNASTATEPARTVRPIFWSNYNSIIDDRSGGEIVGITGKCRRVALMAFLATMPAAATFQEVRTAAFAWRALNPRGKRAGFVCPAAA
jgi:hypothetical protein